MTAGTISAGRNWLPALAVAGYAAAVAVARGTAQWVLAAPLAIAPIAWWLIVSPTAWVSLFFVVVTLAPPIAAGVGDSGVHPSMIVAAAGVAIGALRLREWRFPLSAEGRALVLFAAVLLLSLAPAAFFSGPEIALQSLARAGLFCISVYVFLYVAAGPGREAVVPLRLVYGVALMAAAFACLDFYYQFPAPAGFEQQFVWLETGVYRRAQGLFYEATELGSFCTFFLVMTAVGLVHRVGNRMVLIAGGALFAAALIFSYSRSAVLSLLIALAALITLERARPVVRRLIAWLSGALAAGAVLAYQLFPAFFDLYLLRWWNSAAAALLLGDEHALGNRVEAWRILLRFLGEHPWHALIGVGYKTLPYSDYIGEPVIADNMYLSMLVETGVIGLAALLLLNFTILRAGYRAARSGELQRSFYGAWIFCFWCGETVQMLSGDLLTYWRVLPLFFWVLSMAVKTGAVKTAPVRK